MPSWLAFADVEAEEPEFAARVRAAFDAHAHKFLATLRRDGSPRISGIEMQFVAGEPWLAGMPGSVKFTDLRRDPRFALHSGSAEPDAFDGRRQVSAAAPPRSSTPTSGRPYAAGGRDRAGAHGTSSCSASTSTRSCWSHLNDEKNALYLLVAARAAG